MIIWVTPVILFLFPGYPCVDTTHRPKLDEESVDMSPTGSSGRIANMKVSSKGDFPAFISSTILLWKVNPLFTCSPFPAIFFNDHKCYWYHCIHPGFKLLFRDAKDVRRIKAKMASDRVKFEELPYREMEKLRQVGHWTKRASLQLNKNRTGCLDHYSG